MNYESWRISFQSSEQAAQSAFKGVIESINRVAKLEVQLAEAKATIQHESDCVDAAEDHINKLNVELDARDKLILLAKQALEKAIPLAESWSAPYKQGLEVCHEALASINDSKLVEGLVLCDAQPVQYLTEHYPDPNCRMDSGNGCLIPLYTTKRINK